jgi:hypothetical protein
VSTRATVPIWVKLAYTAFVVVLVPAYIRQYGPGNFLWFSDVALFLGLAAIWLEHPLLASTQAVAVVVPESLWIIEFLLRVTIGVRVVGHTDYMFDESIPVFVRAISLFHSGCRLCSCGWSFALATIAARQGCRLCSEASCCC